MRRIHVCFEVTDAQSEVIFKLHHSSYLSVTDIVNICREFAGDRNTIYSENPDFDSADVDTKLDTLKSRIQHLRDFIAHKEPDKEYKTYDVAFGNALDYVVGLINDLD